MTSVQRYSLGISWYYLAFIDRDCSCREGSRKNSRCVASRYYSKSSSTKPVFQLEGKRIGRRGSKPRRPSRQHSNMCMHVVLNGMQIWAYILQKYTGLRLWSLAKRQALFSSGRHLRRKACMPLSLLSRDPQLPHNDIPLYLDSLKPSLNFIME